MSAQLEQDLRRALAAHAHELPSDASAHLLAGDYRPRAAAGPPGRRGGRHSGGSSHPRGVADRAWQ